MTEDEAKTKWCPMVQTMPGDSDAERCIVSDCMAWRWNAGKNVANPNPHNTDQGYCGLAGKP